MEYHSESDYYICQKGRKLIITSGKKSKSKTGYETIKTQHTCESCDGYSYKARCIKGNNGKTLFKERMKYLEISRLFKRKDKMAWNGS
jgi:hypothetical protein